ncbi:endonuclease MutS2 isoform X2 [Zingiber officinale]|uniref:endonuclease MutS2 isoform X2 n=1 Tax=Zingiber officinale TaxID=94328 RepID=UPI001C4AB0B3|nr:endonuclease MutS2 isoform X2 [Zingiber officinale]
MLVAQRSLALSPIPTLSNPSASPSAAARRFARLLPGALPGPLLLGPGDRRPGPSELTDTLKILEWDKLCGAVAAFAGTALGRDATKAQLSHVDVSFEESNKLLKETAAAVELINYGAGGFDFAGVDTVLVKSAITRVSRGSPLNGSEAMAVVGLIKYADALQVTLKTAVKEDSEWYSRFMPITPMLMDVAISQSFVKSAQLVIDEDGSVKDSASSELRRSRDQVRSLERKVYQLVDKLIRQGKSETSTSEMCIVNGRCCIRVMGDRSTTLGGLLLSSDSSSGSMLEPIAAIPLNDELQQARALVVKAEEDVLSRLTDKMLEEIDDIQYLLQTIISLDVITARAKYSLAYGGTYPDIYLPSYVGGECPEVLHEGVTTQSAPFNLSNKKWKLYMPKCYHPLLLKQHHENLQKAKKDAADATFEIRRNSHGGGEEEGRARLASMKLRVSELEENRPIPVDFMISGNTGVLVITGPNTGGKTISLKTVGLSSLMAKTGVYVIASEPVKIPWFDGIFADIGDEQSLTQSLSTFSGHLRQIGAIRSRSTNKSLVLLDEVGAGTNPLEGAALGMSILESFAEAGSFLTIATTHHGELKTLKYSSAAFENACVEFDELSLKPTYKILWGVPGRSNAINIAERLGLANVIVDGARKLLGTASAEINEVIVDMERFKQSFQQDLQDAERYLMLSKELRGSLLLAKKKIADHGVKLKRRKAKAIADSAAVARSLLRHKLHQFRESTEMKSKSENIVIPNSHSMENLEHPKSNTSSGWSISSQTTNPMNAKECYVPAVGDTVNIPSLGKDAVVLKVEESKGEILVQASNMKLRLKLTDIKS